MKCRNVFRHNSNNGLRHLTSGCSRRRKQDSFQTLGNKQPELVVMNNRARGRGKKRKCPSKGQESKYSQEEVVTNNEEFKQTDSQIRVVPSFIKKKKVAIPAHERIHE
ncbi:uncharacterized protein LOC124274717, partial [Haliotis rubra]|uniref:uncharacterized protein LOC124274717 n=1 Tax=Haliotis rubra TaxID=36100 RepID=UPI001EE555DD